MLRRLGEGANKRVFLAHDERLDRDVAIALVDLAHPGIERSRREANWLIDLGPHPHVVGIQDVGNESGFLYVVEEYMAGGDLAARLAGGEALPLAESLRIGLAICDALAFVHASGLIHRDVKPANVFFAGDETPKLGDFGLALARDASRVTQAGVILGTAAYLAPEQALGGAVSDRSDLYAFGVMLYEMVTGRLPFVGDDPTSLISQHINTPPVAPGWHTQHCPPDLETVILRLLAKAPEDRPSARETLELLRRVDPTGRTLRREDTAENPLDRVARGVFVARESELAVLHAAFDRAHAGRGSLAVIGGEPGIGKTRLVQELGTYARTRGGHVVWGRNQESSGAPAYWPWVEIGTAYRSLRPAEEMKDRLDPQVLRELGRLFPPLLELVDGGTTAEDGDGATQRFRLFDAYASYLRAATGDRPLLIVVDDLQWADEPSLALLQHLAHELPSMRVLVVGTYRNTDLCPDHPLQAVLAGLHRDPAPIDLTLRDLSERDVERYVRGATNQEASAAVIQRVHAETGGNPLFLSELVNLMVQDGTLAGASADRIALPEGMLALLGRRLERLSREGREILRLAAIVGQEFTYDTLNLLGEREEGELLALIDQSLAARVIEETERAGRYRFRHVRMQEAVLAGMSATRRARLHGDVALALERRWQNRLPERAGRLARHFVEAAGVHSALGAKAFTYTKLAAEQAEALTGWIEAARHYERCLALLRDPDLDLRGDEAELLAALGRNQNRAYLWEPAQANLMHAADLYRARGDFEGMGRAMLWGYSVVAHRDALNRVADEALFHLNDESDQYLRARLAASRAELDLGPKGEQAAELAHTLTERHGFRDIAAILRKRDGTRAFAEGRMETAIEIFESLQRDAELAGDFIGAISALERVAVANNFLGRLDEMERLSRELLSLARRRHLRVSELLACIMLADRALARADFESLARVVDETPERAASVAGIDLIGRAWRGEARAALARLPPLERVPEEHRAGVQAIFSVVCLHCGERDEAARRLQKSVELSHAVAGSGPYLYWLVAAAETASSTGDEATARMLYEQLQARPSYRLAQIATDPIRGGIALRLGLDEEAREHFRRGLAWAEEQRAPIEAGRCHQGLAGVAERRGERGEALRELDRAARLFHRHGVKQLLEEALKKKLEIQGSGGSGDSLRSVDRVAQTLQADPPDLLRHSAPNGTVTIVFCDMEGFTPMTERLGDLRAREIVRDYVGIVRERLARHGGFEVELQGDGFLMAFRSGRDAMRCCVEVHRALREYSQQPGNETVRARIGAHIGEALKDADRFFGLNVILAARIAALAEGGEILVSSLLRSVVRSGGEFRFSEGWEVALKGISEKQEIFRLEWS